ncbi:MAG TPA: hypothetical protein VGU61_18270 [Noviherbaspirillum sp.]|nr:hypothetical protein [Noviherbaspirillum sp.]HEV2612217.1 hypothetical protein [Noviherbaspirillum sp.]
MASLKIEALLVDGDMPQIKSAMGFLAKFVKNLRFFPHRRPLAAGLSDSLQQISPVSSSSMRYAADAHCNRAAMQRFECAPRPGW